MIDIWQVNGAGAYDNTGFTLRGISYSNGDGFYLFETIIPGKYLNGAKYRTGHIHFKIKLSEVLANYLINFSSDSKTL